MATTAQQIINGAFDLIGAKAAGESMDAASSLDALRRVNNMIGLWGVQPGTMLAQIREVFDLVANQADYTMGPGGDFDTVRPVYLTGAGLLLTSPSPQVEIGLELYSQQAYDAIAIKDQTSTQPVGVFYTADQPLGTITLWPVPDNATNDLILYSRQAITTLPNLTTSVTFAPGYQEAIEYNLAKRLCAPYGRTMAPEVRELAAQALSWVKTANATMVDLNLDPALTIGAVRPYNILSDM